MCCFLLLVLLRDIVALLFSTFACILLLVLLRDIVTLPFFHFCLYIA